MGLQQVVAPATDPITLGEARQHCRIDHAQDDGLLAGYIIAARAHVETYLRRALIEQTWDLRIDWKWPTRYDRECDRLVEEISIPLPPLRSVTSVSYVDDTGATQTLAVGTSYRVIGAADKGAEGRIVPAYGVTWPVTRRQAEAITVRFVAGYGTNPGDVIEPIRQAMLLLIGHWYENREAVNIGNIVNELPFAVEALLFPHRVFY